jgi:hypothetical protein
MTERRRLPNRRPHEVFDFVHRDFIYTAGIGRDATGAVAEIFLTAAKNGTLIDEAARDAAIVASVALQHGASAETIRHAVTRNADGSASGPIGRALDILAEASA